MCLVSHAGAHHDTNYQPDRQPDNHSYTISDNGKGRGPLMIDGHCLIVDSPALIGTSETRSLFIMCLVSLAGAHHGTNYQPDQHPHDIAYTVSNNGKGRGDR